jgi:hypothetical protein
MAKISFNVDAYTARLIGRENVPNLEGGLLELVKNTYDADASICIVYYEKENNTLYIADNGYGMSKKCIIEHWMTIGNSSKKDNFISSEGRVQTGEKGIGRFALDRLASNCIMITKNEESSHRWEVNWESFKDHKNITDMYAELYENNISFNEFFSLVHNKNVSNLVSQNFYRTGTVFKLTNLRDQWTTSLLKKVKRKLATVIPPSSKNNFKIFLFTENESIKDAQINPEYVENYDYKVTFNISEKGDVKISIHRNEFEFRDKFDYVMKNAGFTNEDRKYFKGEPPPVVR